MNGPRTTERANPSPEDFVEIHTDGACAGNPGPGGWGAVLRFRGNVRELSGGETETTNNRMELRAAVAALETLRRPCSVRIFTDSRYLRDGVTSWIENWRRNGWLNPGRRPVRNADLWKRLDTAIHKHDVKFFWTRGHVGHPDNERADRLARDATPSR